jgi:hypothetical protein
MIPVGITIVTQFRYSQMNSDYLIHLCPIVLQILRETP